MDQNIRANNKKDNNSTTNEIPWYFRRWFWGVLIFFSVLPGFLLYWKEINENFFQKIINFFIYFADSFYSFWQWILPINTLKWSIFYIIFYYIVLLSIFYFAFKKKKINILFSSLILVIIIISTWGLMAGLMFRA